MLINLLYRLDYNFEWDIIYKRVRETMGNSVKIIPTVNRQTFSIDMKIVCTEEQATLLLIKFPRLEVSE